MADVTALLPQLPPWCNATPTGPTSDQTYQTHLQAILCDLVYTMYNSGGWFSRADKKLDAALQLAVGDKSPYPAVFRADLRVIRIVGATWDCAMFYLPPGVGSNLGSDGRAYFISRGSASDISGVFSDWIYEDAIGIYGTGLPFRVGGDESSFNTWRKQLVTNTPHVQNFIFTATGHSLGGTIIAAISARTANGIATSEVFNPGSGPRTSLALSQLAGDATAVLTQHCLVHRVADDWVSSKFPLPLSTGKTVCGICVGHTRFATASSSHSLTNFLPTA